MGVSWPVELSNAFTRTAALDFSDLFGQVVTRLTDCADGDIGFLLDGVLHTVSPLGDGWPWRQAANYRLAPLDLAGRDSDRTLGYCGGRFAR